MTDVDTCRRCGQKHDPTKCAGHSKRSGAPCRKAPMKNQDVCRNHGGASPQARGAAERRGALAIARAEVIERALPTDVDPHTALLDELRRTSGWVLYLESKVDELDEKDLTWGVTRRKFGGDDHGTTKEAKPNAWYVLLTAERKHLLDVANACVKAGIEQRRIQLAEDQGRLIAGAIQQILGRLMLTAEQLALVPEVVPTVLRNITAPAAIEETA